MRQSLVLARTGRVPAHPLARDRSPVDWAWLSSGCIHAQAALALGDQAASPSAYDLLLRAQG